MYDFNIVLGVLEGLFKPKVEKQPLSKENAYALSTIGRRKTNEDVYKYLKTKIIKEINTSARFNSRRLLFEFPEWTSDSDKERLAKYLSEELHYDILYKDKFGMLISWKMSLDTIAEVSSKLLQILTSS